MQDKTTKTLDSRGAYTLFGIYGEVKEEINEELSKLPSGRTRVKRITYRLFGDIVRSYLKICLRDVVIKGYGFPLLNKFGELRAVKTLATRYNPSTYTFSKENGKVVRRKVKINVNKSDGYVTFIFWNCAKKYRHYKMSFARKWKKLLFEQYQSGLELPDISILAYGRTASNEYIQKIK
jgi:hypothetical protein